MALLRNAVPALYALGLYVFIFLPVGVLVLFSFQDGSLPVPPFKGVSLKWYGQAFANRDMMDALANSLLVAVLSSLVSVALGFLAAYGLARHRPRFTLAWQWLIMAPLSISYLIIGLGLLIFFNAVGLPKSLLAVGIGHVVINLPLAFAIVLSQFGAHQVNIERAARDLGAPEWKVLLFVTVPVMWPPLVAAFCLAFTFSWDEFIIAFLVSRFDVTLPVAIWSALRSGLNPEINAVGTLIFGLSVMLFVLARFFLLAQRDSRRG